MAVFFRTPAPPGVFAAGARDCVIVRAERVFEHRRLLRGRAPLTCLWAKGPHGRLSGRWAGEGMSSEPVGEPLRLALAR